VSTGEGVAYKHVYGIRPTDNVLMHYALCLIQGGPKLHGPTYIFAYNIIERLNLIFFGTHKLHKATNGMLPILS